MNSSFKLIIEKIKKNPKFILIVGIIGIVLIAFSNVFERSNSKTQTVSATLSAESYCENLENQLSEQIEEVVGGKVKVMITLETGVEYIYASEAKNDESEIENEGNDDSQKLQKDKKSENNYILYKDENGKEVPLVVTEVMPSVKGVVVGCENGDNEVVSLAVKNLVKTALDISDEKVCVVGLDISRWFLKGF